MSEAMEEGWRRYIVRDPYGPLMATKGLDPSVFWSNIQRDAIRYGLLQEPPEMIEMVREAKRRLKARCYDSDLVDSVIQGVKVTDEEAWAFLHVWDAAITGRIASAGFEMPCEPSCDPAENKRIIERHFRSLGLKADVWLHTSGVIRGLDCISIDNRITVTNPQYFNEELMGHERHSVSSVKALFVAGPSSAVYFWERMTQHDAVFRWPGGQRRANLYIPLKNRMPDTTNDLI